MPVRQQHEPENHGSALHVKSRPNSSATVAVSMLADIDDVLAVARTVALLGNSLRAPISVDLMGESMMRIETGKTLLPGPLRVLLQSIETKLRVTHHSSQGPAFAIEASITADSFLSAGAISMQIRTAEHGSRQPNITR